MDCPKCGYKMPLNDRICRRCRHFPEAKTVVAVAPPRSRFRRLTDRVSHRKLTRLRRVRIRSWRLRWWVFMLLGFVPGLGHVAAGQRAVGVLLAFLVFGLFSLGCHLNSVVGQTLIGISASFHAYSVYDLIPEEQKRSIFMRFILMSVLLVLLLVYIYFPVAEGLNRELLGNDIPMVRNPGSEAAEGLGRVVRVALIFFIGTAVVSYLFSKIAPHIPRRRRSQ